MTKTTLVACFVLCACGSGGDDPDLVGKWLVLNADQSCAAGWSFTADGHFERDLACQRDDGGFDVEAHAGTYEVDGDRVTVHVTAASCQDAPETATLSYELAGKELRVTSPDGLEVLERAPSGSGGGSTGTSATYGCFAADGSFAPMPVHTL